MRKDAQGNEHKWTWTLFKWKNIPKYYYNLSGTGRCDERLVLIQNDNMWEVYYLERGIKTTDLLFNTEFEACKYIANILVKDLNND